MSRLFPWRNKPSQLVTEMLPVVDSYRLYLLQQIGCTSFIFKDENDTKFKVTIGNTISCSCGVMHNEHCLHTLFVMLKRFKVPPTTPILWQVAFLDSELQGLVSGKYKERVREVETHSIRELRIKARKKEDVIMGGDSSGIPAPDGGQQCPICYEQMENQCYSGCPTCRKCFHTKCFKIWTKHKEDSNVAVTCPLCRYKFTNPMTVILRDQEAHQLKFVVHKGSNCRNCHSRNFKGTLYRCLICDNFQLCKACYEVNKHEHSKFGLKQLASDKWRLNIKGRPELSMESEMVCSFFQTVRQFNQSQSRTIDLASLNVIGNEIVGKLQCMKCKLPGGESMKRVPCGHYLHSECLQSMLANHQLHCQIDHAKLCSGFMNVMGIKTKDPRSEQSSKEKIEEETERREGREENQIKERRKEGEKNQMQLSAKKIMKLNPPSQIRHKSTENKFRIIKKSDRKDQNLMGIMSMGMVVTGYNNPPRLPPRGRSTLRIQ